MTEPALRTGAGAMTTSAVTELKEFLDKPDELVLPYVQDTVEEVEMYEDTPVCTGPQNLWGVLGPKTERRKVKRQVKTKGYDLELDVSNLESVLRRKEGWHLKINGNPVWEKLQDSQLINVGIVGVFNRGKTTVTNMLTSRAAEVGNLSHTLGISAMLDDNFIYLDTAGQNMPLDLVELQDTEKIRDKTQRTLLGEQFSSDLVVALSDLLIVVVNQLTLEDQRYVRTMEEKVKAMESTNAKKQIIVIHNLKDVTTTKALEHLVEKDIVRGFHCRQKAWEGKRYWTSATNVAHAVIARNDSEASKDVNDSTITFIRNYINAKYATSGDPTRRTMLRVLSDYAEEHLWKFFKDFRKESCKLMCDPKMDGVTLYLDYKGPCTDMLAKNAFVNEWQIIWGAKYEIEYQVKASNDKKSIIVKMEIPGVFSTSPAEGEHKVPLSNNFVQVHNWSRDGRDVVELKVRLTRLDGKGPSVELQCYRSPMDEEGEVLYGSGKTGSADLNVDLSTISDGYSAATVTMHDNGMLVVKMEKGEKLEDALAKLNEKQEVEKVEEPKEKKEDKKQPSRKPFW